MLNLRSVLKYAAVVAGFGLAWVAQAALAAPTLHPGGFPTPVGPIANEIGWLYNFIFIIIAVVALVVAVPVVYILWRYRRTKVAKPATFSHNMAFELAWTLIPALICIAIAWYSYKSMVMIRTMPEDAMNVEVVAYQFGWDFYYPDVSVGEKHVAAPEPTTDDPEVSLPNAPRQTKTLVVPVGKPVVMHVTAQDVIHAVFVPHLGIKIDAIPGRINYAWFTATEPGNWLGQCAELCGSAHGEMFFRVKALPQAEFDTWLAAQKLAAGITDEPAQPLAEDASATVLTPAEAVAAAPAGLPSPTLAPLPEPAPAPAPQPAPQP